METEKTEQRKKRIEYILSCTHTVRSLQKAGIITMEELSEKTYDDLLKIRGIGKVIASNLAEESRAWQEANGFSGYDPGADP